MISFNFLRISGEHQLFCINPNSHGGAVKILFFKMDIQLMIAGHSESLQKCNTTGSSPARIRVKCPYLRNITIYFTLLINIAHFLSFVLIERTRECNTAYFAKNELSPDFKFIHI
jgi:hypothetical protein